MRAYSWYMHDHSRGDCVIWVQDVVETDIGYSVTCIWHILDASGQPYVAPGVTQYKHEITFQEASLWNFYEIPV